MLLPLKAIIGKDVRRNGTSAIYFQYCYSSTNRVLLNTEVAIPSEYWNLKRQCISKMRPASFRNYEFLNNEIIRIRKVIEALIEKSAADDDTNKGLFVKKYFTPTLSIDDVLSAPESTLKMKKKEPDFFEEMERYIAVKSKQVCASGLANFRTTRDRLLCFQKQRHKKILFKDLDYSFYIELVEYLTFDYVLRRKKNMELGLKLSSIGKTIKQLRMFVKDRVRRKIIPPVDMGDFKILDEETDAIYLV